MKRASWGFGGLVVAVAIAACSKPSGDATGVLPAGADAGAAIAQGQALYAQQCAACHGPNGEGVKAPSLRDWSRSGLSGRYAAAGLDLDLEAAMAALTVDVHAVALADDWLGPEPSLRFLLSRLRRASPRIDVLDAAALGTRADHYAWMKHPGAVVSALLG